MPANNVETEARECIGNRIRGQAHPIEAAIALRYPAEFAHIDKALEETNDLESCAVYPKGKRFPTTGRLKGSVCDLADLIHLVDVPMTAFHKCAEDLEARISGAIIANAILFQERIAAVYPDDIPSIHRVYGRHANNRQRNALETWRKILEINYWPIFDAAIQIIDALTVHPSSEVLENTRQSRRTQPRTRLVLRK